MTTHALNVLEKFSDDPQKQKKYEEMYSHRLSVIIAALKKTTPSCTEHSTFRDKVLKEVNEKLWPKIKRNKKLKKEFKESGFMFHTQAYYLTGPNLEKILKVYNDKNLYDAIEMFLKQNCVWHDSKFDELKKIIDETKRDNLCDPFTTDMIRELESLNNMYTWSDEDFEREQKLIALQKENDVLKAKNTELQHAITLIDKHMRSLSTEAKYELKSIVRLCGKKELSGEENESLLTSLTNLDLLIDQFELPEKFKVHIKNMGKDKFRTFSEELHVLVTRLEGELAQNDIMQEKLIKTLADQRTEFQRQQLDWGDKEDVFEDVKANLQAQNKQLAEELQKAREKLSAVEKLLEEQMESSFMSSDGEFSDDVESSPSSYSTSPEESEVRTPELQRKAVSPQTSPKYTDRFEKKKRTHTIKNGKKEQKTARKLFGNGGLQFAMWEEGDESLSSKKTSSPIPIKDEKLRQGNKALTPLGSPQGRDLFG